MKSDESLFPKMAAADFLSFAQTDLCAIIMIAQLRPSCVFTRKSYLSEVSHMLELLSPAGSMESLRAAVHNGADAGERPDSGR